MTANEIVNLYNEILGIGDTLDDLGVGVYALTDGGFKTREALKLELSQFLLYIGNANGSFDDGEVALMNIILGENHTASAYEQLSARASEPSPNVSLSLLGFISGDKTLNKRNGTNGATQLCDMLIDFYEGLANVMLAFDKNKDATVRKIKFINGMKAYVMKSMRE